MASKDSGDCSPSEGVTIGPYVSRGRVFRGRHEVVSVRAGDSFRVGSCDEPTPCIHRSLLALGGFGHGAREHAPMLEWAMGYGLSRASKAKVQHGSYTRARTRSCQI